MRRRQRKKQRASSARTLPDLLELAGERIAEIEAAARRADSDLAEAVARVRADELFEGPDGSRERIIEEIVTSVVERSAALRDETEALAALLARCAPLLEQPQDPKPAPPARAEAADDVEEEDEEGFDAEETEPEVAGPGVERQSPGASVSEGMRLLATQMAVAGSSRSEIEDRLRSELNVRDPEALVDEVLGSARVH